MLRSACYLQLSVTSSGAFLLKLFLNSIEEIYHKMKHSFFSFYLLKYVVVFLYEMRINLILLLCHLCNAPHNVFCLYVIIIWRRMLISAIFCVPLNKLSSLMFYMRYIFNYTVFWCGIGFLQVQLKQNDHREGVTLCLAL